MKKLILIIFAVALIQLTVIQKCSAYSVEELCSKHPERINILFENLNMDYAGLEDVKQAFDNGDKKLACKKLIEYYESYGSGGWLRDRDATPTERLDIGADLILQDTFTFQGVEGVVPRDDKGFH